MFFAARQLKQFKRDEEVNEQDLQDYILDWKKSWRTDDKKQAVVSAIRNLMLFGWLQSENQRGNYRGRLARLAFTESVVKEQCWQEGPRTGGIFVSG